MSDTPKTADFASDEPKVDDYEEKNTLPKGEADMTTTTEPIDLGDGLSAIELKAEIITYDKVPMSAVNRCDRCGAQAYVEVLLDGAKQSLLFCAHDAHVHWLRLLSLDCTISDHRPYLEAQEGRPRDAAAAPK